MSEDRKGYYYQIHQSEDNLLLAYVDKCYRGHTALSGTCHTSGKAAYYLFKIGSTVMLAGPVSEVCIPGYIQLENLDLKEGEEIIIDQQWNFE